jgi:L-amino acid N-acyltransferase YncA
MWSDASRSSARAVVTIRAARPQDAGAVAAIYNAGMAERQATFETRPRAPGEIVGWLDSGLPFIVAEDGDGRVVGFARVTPYSDRPFYAGVGEHTLYVDAAARAQGLGRRLLEEIAAEAERRGMYKLTSRIFTTNEASRAVHRAAGFAEVGVKRFHGRLDGEWKHCVLVERLLGEAAAATDESADGGGSSYREDHARESR